MDFETFWYETFPYLYGVAGVVLVLLPGGSGLLKGSGVLLIAASITILRVRRTYRRRAYMRLPDAAQVSETAPAGD